MAHLRTAIAPLLATTALLRAEVSIDDPAASFGLAWTGTLKWSQVVDVASMPGADADAKLAAAQQQLAAKGGGVAWFPSGEYRFKQTIRLKDGVILRGSPPAGETDARKDGYRLSTRFVFPKFEFSAEGDGTPIDTAFKAIVVEDPATTSNCGVVHLDINRGHILFDRAEDGSCGRNRLVVGCILRNTAFADPGVPDASIGQKPWQRHTWRFGAAIEVKTTENLLIANNRLPKSGGDDFTMDGYVVKGRGGKPVAIDGVPFDYDNRPGIYANHESLGGPGGQGPDGTPETHPLGFRKGVVITNNSIHSTGRCAISFSGDGTLCSGNVIRFEKDVWRPTATGRDQTTGSSTNDTRAIEMRGWRWEVIGNDYEVHRNWACDRKYPINDGEGLMHEDHANSTIVDSVLSHNRGNAYLSLYKTAGIDGLTIEGNDIRPPGEASRIAAIYVNASRNSGSFPCRSVRIVGNTVGGNILIEGSPVGDNVVENNRFSGRGRGMIQNRAGSRLNGNQGFEVRE